MSRWNHFSTPLESLSQEPLRCDDSATHVLLVAIRHLCFTQAPRVILRILNNTAEQFLNQAELEYARKVDFNNAITISRQAVQAASDARAIALRHKTAQR